MNKISQRLNEHANTVEAALHGYLDVRTSVVSPLYEAVKYSTYAGGKRIRPALVMEFCRMFGGSDAMAIPFACAVECVHTYSLIHDDLPCMDDDDLRRGKPSNHKVYGEATALLAGDALLTFAFELLAEKSIAPKSDTLAAIAILAKCAGMAGMIGGQQLDLNGERNLHDLETIKQMDRMKTGALLKASCQLGCCAAGYSSDRAKLDAAAEYAEHLGVAFQAIDDVLDVEGNEKTMGKQTHLDTGKTTFLRYMTPGEARTFAAAETRTACRAIEFYPGSEFLTELAKELLNRNK